jgi:OHCU decarboxylase
LTLGLRLEDLNTLPDDAAVAHFLRCCGSIQWARLMAGKRPFASIAQAAGQADRVWASLRAEDWLEAFAAHPRIGDSGTGAPARDASESTRLEWGPDVPGTRNSATSPSAGEKKIAVAEANGWSLVEQAQVSAASPGVRDRLAAANREYEARFGYIFIVCATGKSAEEMLALLERRMTHAPGDELAVAAEEQRRITRLRLGKLLIA